MSPTAPTLTDGTLTLRAHRDDDLPRVLEQSRDPLSQEWTRVPVPYSGADARDFVHDAVRRGWADDSEWAFALEHDGRFGGTVSLRHEGDGVAEIAFGSHPDVRGTGAVERALRLLLAWGFEERELRTVLWRAHRGNWASRRLAWRLGFTFDGTVRQWLPQRGALHDAWVGTLLRGEPREPRSPWPEVPVLDADGLRLRPWRAGDVRRIVEACSDPVTERWLGQLPSPYGEPDARAWLEATAERLARGEAMNWAVVDPADDDAVLASVGWFGWTPGVECEVGYWTHPEARGRRVATRAMAAAVGHAFAELRVRRVTAFSAVENRASRRVIEANGFTQYGVERLGANVRGGRADLALYDVLATEWPPRPA